MKALTVDQLARRLAEAAPVLLDVREPWEYEHARIEGSLNIPMHTVPARLGELDPNAEIVVICHHGARSAQVTLYLMQQGYTEVYNLTGGIDAWSRQIDPAVPAY